MSEHQKLSSLQFNRTVTEGVLGTNLHSISSKFLEITSAPHSNSGSGNGAGLFQTTVNQETCLKTIIFCQYNESLKGQKGTFQNILLCFLQMKVSHSGSGQH